MNSLLWGVFLSAFVLDVLLKDTPNGHSKIKSEDVIQVNTVNKETRTETYKDFASLKILYW